jgi:hypothetical protein
VQSCLGLLCCYIHFRIDFYKTGEKESIFKLEEKRKLDILQRVGSIVRTDGHQSEESISRTQDGYTEERNTNNDMSDSGTDSQ